MTAKVRYKRNAELPSLEIWWLDDDGDLVDMSTASGFTLKIGNVGSTALLTKTSGITGAAGSGSEVSGVPNVTVAWSAGELDLTPGRYTMQLFATFTGGQRDMDCSFVVEDVIA
jgi:hypothetical protein